jgi:hypothetical protein
VLRACALCAIFAATLAAQKPFGIAVDSFEDSVWQGQPAIFSVQLFPVDIADPKIESGTITLRIRKQSGEIVDWPLKPRARIAFPLEFKPMQTATEHWVLTPEETAQLEPGSYIAEALIDTLVSRRFLFNVIPVEDPNTTPILRNRAAYLVLTGEAPAAVSVLEEAILRNPKNHSLHYQLALAQEKSGMPEAALESVVQALAIFKSLFHSSKHPPLEYMRLRSKLDWGIE